MKQNYDSRTILAYVWFLAIETSIINAFYCVCTIHNKIQRDMIKLKTEYKGATYFLKK